MANIKRRVESLENRMTTLENQVSNVVTKLDMFIEESRAARKRQDDDMREIRQNVDGMGKHVRNMSIVTIIGVATIVVAVFLK